MDVQGHGWNRRRPEGARLQEHRHGPEARSSRREYKSAAGLIKSHWRYECNQLDLGMKWVWDFTIPEGATADVTLPGETESKRYTAGTYHVVKDL